jgi:hypothetical protein
MSWASPSLSGTILESQDLQFSAGGNCAQETNYAPLSGTITGEYAGSFNGFVSAAGPGQGAPLTSLRGQVNLTGDPDGALAGAMVTLAFDSSASSSSACDGVVSSTEEHVYSATGTADYQAHIVMNDGTVCRDEGKANVDVAHSIVDGVPVGSFSVAFGPSAFGDDAVCTDPSITLTPSIELDRGSAFTQTVFADGIGFAPGQSVVIALCDADGCADSNVAAADEDGTFSARLDFSGLAPLRSIDVDCDRDEGVPTPCRLVALDSLLRFPLAEVPLSFVPFPTFTSIGASTTLVDTLEITGTNLDQFEVMLVDIGSQQYFVKNPPFIRFGEPNPTWIVVNEWSSARISITWTENLSTFGRDVTRLQLISTQRGSGISDHQVSFALVESFGPPDADHDGIPDDLDSDNGTGTAPPGFTNVVAGRTNPTAGTLVSGSVTVADAADSAKGVRITATTAAVLSVCPFPTAYELELEAGSSVTLTCGSVSLADVTGGTVTVVVPGGASVSFPEGTSGTVDTLGGLKVTSVSGDGVTVTIGGVSRPLSQGSSNVIQTGAGNSTVNGTSGNDVIVDAGGNNTIDGKAGDDTVVVLGPGNQAVKGGAGNDRITTGSGNDSIEGGDGDDEIDAGNGNNSVSGGAGNDTIVAGTGKDSVDGGPGTDVCNAGGGKDSVKNCSP